MPLYDLRESIEKISTVRKYIVPSRIVDGKDVDNEKVLLCDSTSQTAIGTTDTAHLHENGYVLLDFGSEIHGGICLNIASVFNHKQQGSYDKGYGKARLVFGESVSEAMSTVGDENGALNDHAFRDMTVDVCTLSTRIFGNTGFRFVKIQAVDCEFKIKSAKAVLEYRDLEYKGSFRCDDDMLNKVFDTAAYTVHLNMQNYIWDGVKRDRLVWVGDMHPEVSTIRCVFGHDESVENSLDLSRDLCPLTGENKRLWMCFPSYSAWWITIHRDWYMQNGNKEYLLEQKEYMYQLCENFLSCIKDDGTLDFGDAHNPYFVDWSSNKTEYMEAGFRGCIAIGMKAASDIFSVYGDENMKKRCLEASENVKKIVPVYGGNKQVTAMTYLSDMTNFNDVEKLLTTDIYGGLSTFYGYYVLEALAKGGKTYLALDIIRNFWGGMLKLGATTFWEDFDIDWLENAAPIDEFVPEGKVDVHTSYGKFCYQKLRHSLCHGWASGPCPFLINHVLGVTVLEAGCKKVKISPNLACLKWAKGTYPTPYGVIEIEHKVIDGKVESVINAPDEVEIVLG